MKKKISILLVIILAMVFISIPGGDVFATSTNVITVPYGTTYTLSGTIRDTEINVEGTVIIPEGYICSVATDSAINISQNGNLINNGTLQMLGYGGEGYTSDIFTNSSQRSRITNNGTITVYGGVKWEIVNQVYNNGTIDIQNDAFLSKYASTNGKLFNTGTLKSSNSDAITIQAYDSASLINSITLDNLGVYELETRNSNLTAFGISGNVWTEHYSGGDSFISICGKIYEKDDSSMTEVSSTESGKEYKLCTYAICYEGKLGGRDALTVPSTFSINGESVTPEISYYWNEDLGLYFVSYKFTTDLYWDISIAGTNVPKLHGSTFDVSDYNSLAECKDGYGPSWYETNGDTDSSNKIISEPFTVLRSYIIEYDEVLEDYTITYELNSGTNNTSNPKTYNIESKTITLLSPTRENYTFDGWYKDENMTEKVTSIEKGSFGDINLYAKWTPAEYDINYHLGGGENNEGNPDTYNVESSSITLLDPSYDGYDFSGWYTDENFENEFNSIETGSTGSVDVYAKWIPHEYTVTYVMDNGATNSSSNPAVYTIEDNISLKSPKMSGYSFKGWYKDEAMTEKVTEIPSGSTGDIILYAKFVESSSPDTGDNMHIYIAIGILSLLAMTLLLVLGKKHALDK